MVGNSQGINVGPVNSSIVSLAVNVEEGLPRSRESALFVTLRNEGEKTVQSLFLSMSAPVGIQIIDPGDLFGSANRSHRTESLTPKQSMKFKLAIRTHEEFRAGTLTLDLLDSDPASRSANTHFRVEVNLRSYERSI